MDWINALRGLPIGEALVVDHKVSTVNVGATKKRVLKSNPNRIGLIMSVVSAADVIILPSSAVTATLGVPISTSFNPWILSDLTYPGLAGTEWWAIAPVSLTPITVIETILVPVPRG